MPREALIERNAQIVADYLNRVPFKDMEEKYGISRQAMHVIARRAGATPRGKVQGTMVLNDEVEASHFIEVWQNSSTAQAVADQFNIGAHGASVIAAHLRKAGHDLKVMQIAGPKTRHFVEVWNRSESLAEAAEILGRTMLSVKVYASQLRSRGHDLKVFRQNIERLPVPRLSAAYMAGLFDASGYLAIREREQRGRTFYAVKAVLSISNEALLIEVQERFGGSIQKKAENYMSLDWNSRKGILELIEYIQPYSIVLAEKINQMIEFIKGGT